jgi:acyl carrier protein
MLEKIKEIVAEALSAEADELTADTSFIDDLEADSLDLFEMVMSLEDEFGVQIPTEDLEQLKTIGDVETYIREHK